MQTHLHSVPGRRGHSLYDKDTGNCQQSWHKSGHRPGQKSIHQCLCGQKEVVRNMKQSNEILGLCYPSYHSIFPVFLFIIVFIAVVTQQQKMRLLKSRRLLMSRSDWPPAVAQFSISMRWNGIFEITSGCSRSQKKVCSSLYKKELKGWFSPHRRPANHFPLFSS